MIGINFFLKLRNKLTGLNATTARFDILQSNLDGISASLKAITVSIKNLEAIAKGKDSTEHLEKMVEQSNNANSQDEFSLGVTIPIAGVESGHVNSFYFCLLNKILNSMGNYYINNHDISRFGNRPIRFADIFNFVASKVGLFSMNKTDNSFYRSRLLFCREMIENANYLFNLLDERSQELFLSIVAYRILGDRKVMLPYQAQKSMFLKKIKKCRLPDYNAIKIEILNMDFHRFDLSSIGYNINIYSFADGIFTTFIFNQYVNDAIGFILKPGDTVIDGGGCYGDTSVLFSKLVGESGNIYSFEFIEDNLNIFNKNIEINNVNNIEIIKYALWDHSDEEIIFSNSGPGSSAVWIQDVGNTVKVRTLTIDDLVIQKKIKKIDFIKMDIEGSELKALIGAVNTIKSFRPKLAISIYHKNEDIYEIPKFIHQLDLGYTFTINHGSMHAEETVLLCQ